MSRIHLDDGCIEVEALGDAEAFSCDDAEVWIEDGLILISYFDEEGIVVLEGRAEDDGGWALMARSRPRRAFLRPLPEKTGCFVGEIEEQGETCAWRVTLRALAKESDV
ncbi:MAG: hypothetical protein AB8G23_13030 [Myxococcota bacterium]